VRHIEVIDAELRLLATIRHCIRSEGGQPSTTLSDALLDERTDLSNASPPHQVAHRQTYPLEQ
jgi:hypothetical protein